MKALSKSRFKQGLECPNKVYFANNPEDFHNVKNDDSFLQALASGGFQIEAYARLLYPDGVLIEGANHDYQELADQTARLLIHENVVIFEAAFYREELFARTDILVKKGNNIQLIEVKAKSINPNKKHNFVGKLGDIVSGWKPYLFDLAFQSHVVQLCMPQCEVTPFLSLVDKSQITDFEGLNQMFRIKQTPDKRTIVEVLEKDFRKLGNNLLHQPNMADVVAKIHEGTYKYHENLDFHEAIILLSGIRKKNYYPNWPAGFSACKKCEFKKDGSDLCESKESGFEHCFKAQYQWTDADFKTPNIFNIWDLKDPKLMEQGLLFKSQLKKEDVKYKEESDKLHRTQRQWLQIEKERTEDLTEFVDVEGLRNEMSTWVFPLHFIDFETSTVPLPFHKGRKPYEQIAFQFSHHIYHKDGRIEHATEYVNTKPGEFPNFKFAQHLFDALSHDDGTIFRFATHENTILNAIRDQLKESKDSFKPELVSFIESISHPKDKHPDPWIVPQRQSGKGTRDMVDLCEVIKRYYYNPHTQGSNSIKKVLPAVLKSSTFIQAKYAKPIISIGLGSKNFPPEQIWLEKENGEIRNPYNLLPSLYENLTQEEIETTLSELDNVNDGGAALTAYGKIQYMDMSAKERNEIGLALKRYCELDTLAMVIIYEHLKTLV